MAFCLALSFVVGAAAPAQASHTNSNSRRAAEQQRDSVGQWVPQNVQFISGTVPGTTQRYMTWSFEWFQQDRMNELEGLSHFIELNAEVDCTWAGINGYQDGEGYDGTGFSTNIPAAALPYEDSTFNEPCTLADNHSYNQSSSGRGKFGIGVMNAQALVPNTQYTITIYLHDGLASNGTSSSAVTLRAGTGTVYDVTNTTETTIFPMLAFDCNFSDSEITNPGWNYPSDQALGLRLQASWCDWKDYAHKIADTTTGTSVNINTDKLYNQGMGEGLSAPGLTGYNFWSENGSGSVQRYCNDSFPAYEASCFFQFNNGGAGGSSYVLQDDLSGVTAGNSLTTEAAVRCRTSGGCSIMLEAAGINPTNEVWLAGYTVPNDGHWWMCRMDTDHGSAGVLASNHDRRRWAVGNLSSGSIDIDFGFAGNKTTVEDPSPGGVPSAVGQVNAGSPDFDADLCHQR